MTKFLAAALQLGPASPTIGETTERILALIDKAAAAGVRLAALPELALTPYFAAEVHSDLDRYTSLSDNAAAMEAISARVKAANMAITVPFAELAGNEVYNSMAIFDDEGKQVGTFRKMHIPGQVDPKPEGAFTILEKRYFLPGDLGFGVFDTGPGKVGGLICYDRRFPESFRSLANNGADVICVGYNTPAMKPGTIASGRRASELAMQAGAYSTGTYVLGVGKAGVEGGVKYIGGSVIIGPDGMVIKRAKSAGDEMIVAEIDLDRQQAIRDRWNFPVNRRTDYVMTAAV